MTTIEKIRAEIANLTCDCTNGMVNQYAVLQIIDKYAEQEPTDEWQNGYDMAWEEAKVFYEQEPCDDAVSRQAVLDGLKGCICDEWVKTLFATMVKQLPSVTQKPNFCASCKHNTDNEICLECEYDGITRGMTRYESVTQKSGKWIIRDDLATVRYYQCSECNEIDLDISDYCPNCGAKMEREG